MLFEKFNTDQIVKKQNMILVSLSLDSDLYHLQSDPTLIHRLENKIALPLDDYFCLLKGAQTNIIVHI